MHWSEKIAKDIIKRSPDKEEYVCAAGISPSGSIHIGNFRDIATSYFVYKALIKQGKKARLLFSWDEFDRFRKVPVNVKEVAPELENEIGKPYVDVKDPYGCCSSYAEHFEKEFEASLSRFGVKVDFRRQSENYRSGKYAKYIIQAVQKRREIFDILDKFRQQVATPEEREAYYPVSIYCPVCGKDETTITSSSEDGVTCEYTCKCGHKGTWDFSRDFNCKLAWKIDWPMRWMIEGVDFEPGGKDHASPGGSYDTSKIIAKKIFGAQAPMFKGYEFVGIKGTTGKMSGSTGLNLTPDTLLKIYQPEMILWLYSKSEPNKAFDFCFDDEILRQYFEFDKMLKVYQAGKGKNYDYIEGIMHNCMIEGRELYPVPMQQIVNFGSVVDFNADMLETVFEKIGTPYKKEEFAERLELAKYWLEKCSPENMNTLLGYRNWDFYNTLNEVEKKEIQLLHDFIAKGEYDLDALNSFIYTIPREADPDFQEENKKTAQAQFFKNAYNLMIGKAAGPRLYLFLFAVEPQRYLGLLDFSTPQTEEEKTLAAEAKAEAERKAAEEEARRKAAEEEEARKNAIAPIKEEITIDEFDKVDMRVCKVINCEIVKNAKKLLKLTLFDGLDERVIVSSIRDDYTPEELIGRKIIVIANLKPAKFAGVKSNGMLIDVRLSLLMTAYQKEQQFTKIFFKHALKCFYDILQRIQTDKIYNARHILPGWYNVACIFL